MVVPSVGPLLIVRASLQMKIEPWREGIFRIDGVGELPINMNMVSEHGHAALDMSSYIA